MAPPPKPRKHDLAPWKKRVLAEVTAHPPERVRQGGYVSRLLWETPSTELAALLRDAADRRGCSAAAYIRRATMLLIAQDLDIPMADLLQLDPRVSLAGARTSIIDPEGRVAGPWGPE